MALITLRQLLECGVHFGHPTRKWEPKMSPYIYTKRNGIHILDLQQTTRFIDEVHGVVQELVNAGKSILFVGTKKQAQDAVREEATKCGMPYICNRWPGGLLTNRATMAKRIERLRDLRKQKEEGYFEQLTKKDAKFLTDEMEKLEKVFGGLADMDGLPDALFIVDVKKEQNAVMEAKKLNIPIIGILDTNCDPDDVQYKLPGNDDAIRSIRLFCQIIADSVMEAKYGYLPPDSVFIRAAEEQDEESSSGDRSKDGRPEADSPAVEQAAVPPPSGAGNGAVVPPPPTLASQAEPEAAPEPTTAPEPDPAPASQPEPEPPVAAAEEPADPAAPERAGGGEEPAAAPESAGNDEEDNGDGAAAGAPA